MGKMPISLRDVIGKRSQRKEERERQRALITSYNSSSLFLSNRAMKNRIYTKIKNENFSSGLPVDSVKDFAVDGCN